MKFRLGKKFNGQLIAAIIFLIKLNLLSIPLYVILYLNLSYFPFQVFVASVSARALNFFGYSVLQLGNVLTILSSEQFLRVDVSWDSSGWKSIYALTALVMATPLKGYLTKLKFLALALPSMFLINILRIVSTVSLSIFFGLQYFPFLHTVLWRAISIGIVVAFWALFLWTKRYNIVKTQSRFRIRWFRNLNFLGLKTG